MKSISWEELQSMGNPDNLKEDLANKENDSTPKKNGKVRVYLEKNKGAAKKVSVIKGLDVNEDLGDLCKILKNSLGVGGAVKDNEIILQGDQRTKLIAKLIDLGYTDVKNAGQ